ncbi:reverse transcriptase domain-containing protein [Tanacetum coccineum]
MTSPRTLCEVQALNDASTKKDFQWSTEAETAFQELKNHLQSLPTLTIPRPGETLVLYLAAATEAISAVLLTDKGNVQKPIYFVSRALQGAEINYPSLKKVALALVHVVRRLRLYFQAHTICVLTDQPIRKVLLKPKNSGRLAKWAIELGEHEIVYKPRSVIKGQVLADFLTGFPTNNNDTMEKAPHTSGKGRTPTWTLFTIGASRMEGSEAGLILTDPDGQEITYAFWFNFRTSNNEAEYESLVAGLELAIQMEAQRIDAYTDSLLIVNQVKGVYEAREDLIKRYLSKVQGLQKHFKCFTITQVPRSENKRADALSKLASSSFAHLTKSVLVEIAPCRSIDVKPVSPVKKAGPTWMDPILKYLKIGALPNDIDEARKIRIKAPQYSLKGDVLYRKGYLTPWLRCVGPEQASYVLREAHFGSCSAHAGARTIAQKVARLGYY